MLLKQRSWINQIEIFGFGCAFCYLERRKQFIFVLCNRIQLHRLRFDLNIAKDPNGHS